MTPWKSHLFEGFLFALAELLIFKFPLTEFSLQPFNALTQSELVTGDDTEAQHSVGIVNAQSCSRSSWEGYYLSQQMFHILHFHIEGRLYPENQ